MANNQGEDHHKRDKGKIDGQFYMGFAFGITLVHRSVPLDTLFSLF